MQGMWKIWYFVTRKWEMIFFRHLTEWIFIFFDYETLNCRKLSKNPLSNFSEAGLRPASPNRFSPARPARGRPRWNEKKWHFFKKCIPKRFLWKLFTWMFFEHFFHIFKRLWPTGYVYTPHETLNIAKIGSKFRYSKNSCKFFFAFLALLALN